MTKPRNQRPQAPRSAKYLAYLGPVTDPHDFPGGPQEHWRCEGCGRTAGTRCHSHCPRRRNTNDTLWEDVRWDETAHFHRYEVGPVNYNDLNDDDEVITFDEYRAEQDRLNRRWWKEFHAKHKPPESRDERFYKPVAEPRPCLFCGKERPLHNTKYCSRACHGSQRDKDDLDRRERLRVDIRTCAICRLWYQPTQENQVNCHYEDCQQLRKKMRWAKGMTHNKPRKDCPLCGRSTATGVSLKRAGSFGNWMPALYGHKPCGVVSEDGRYVAPWDDGLTNTWEAVPVSTRRREKPKTPAINWTPMPDPAFHPMEWVDPMPPPGVANSLATRLMMVVRKSPQAVGRGSVGNARNQYRAVVLYTDRSVVEYYAKTMESATTLAEEFAVHEKVVGAWIEGKGY